MNETISFKFAEYTKNSKYEILSASTIEQAKKCLLDFIGVAIAGKECPLNDILLSLGFQSKRGKNSTVIGRKDPIYFLFSSLINGTIGHYLELDDGHRPSISHPGTVVIPSALAMGEVLGSSGKEILLSIVLGYEIIGRIGRSIQPSHQTKRGFHTTGTCGTFGAALTSAKLLDLSINEIVYSLGLAGLQASGLLEVMNNGGMAKPFHAGKASFNGILSSLMAKKKVKSPITIFEGSKGFINAMSDHWQKEKIFDKLGEDFLISETYFKFHAACGLVHSTIDAIIKIVQENNIESRQIKKIKLKVLSYVADIVNKENQEIESPEDAKFNLQFNAAIAVIDQSANIEEYSNEKITNQEIRDLMKRVKVVADTELDNYFPERRPSIAEVELFSGENFNERIDFPKGSPENPPSFEDVYQKYMQLVLPYIEKNIAEEIVELIQNFDMIENINIFTKLLRLNEGE